MYQQNALAQIAPADCFTMPIWGSELRTSRLTDDERAEVLEFLSLRPLHTVAMAGFIRDNGLVSELNRGSFYGCRNAQGQLEGVALVGHSILFETRSAAALQALANVAKSCTNTHIIMGEQERVAEFWTYYAAGGQVFRHACTEILLELRWPVEIREEVVGLRLATLEDLHLIMPVHAQMSYQESGVNPLEKDPVGFERRCARRVELNRTYVWVEDGKLVFKADVLSDTPETIYLEGIWINPELSGKGYALRCLSQLARTLLQRSQSICLLTNVQNEAAQRLYKKAGFKNRGIYDSIFVESSQPTTLETTAVH